MNEYDETLLDEECDNFEEENEEFIPPKDEECEFCGHNPATEWVQDHAVCEDCYQSAYEKLILPD
ncbi:hypothetical protein ACFGW0_01485 [Pasteurella multocida]